MTATPFHQHIQPPQPTGLPSVADLIANAGGIPSAFNKDSPIGTTVQGTITEADVRQVSDYETQKLEFWDDGSPKQQVRIVVQTGMVDPSIENDTGERAIYVKWWGDQRKQLLQAIRAAGDTDIRVGGTFRAAFTGTKPNDNPRLSDIKLYQFAYTAPVPSAGLDVPPEPAPAPVPVQAAPVQQQPVQAAPVQQPAPAPVQQAPAPAAVPAGGVDVDKIKQLLAVGLDDATIAGAVGADPTVVAAIRNLP